MSEWHKLLKQRRAKGLLSPEEQRSLASARALEPGRKLTAMRASRLSKAVVALIDAIRNNRT